MDEIVIIQDIDNIVPRIQQATSTGLSDFLNILDGAIVTSHSLVSIKSFFAKPSYGQLGGTFGLTWDEQPLPSHPYVDLHTYQQNQQMADSKQEVWPRVCKVDKHVGGLLPEKFLKMLAVK